MSVWTARLSIIGCDGHIQLDVPTTAAVHAALVAAGLLTEEMTVTLLA
ncbi:MAG: hypothetical protein IT555_18905 [Acetobacteraceae bacterium]|nr:hypothetical protein [Acetobacteraceae bacterium]